MDKKTIILKVALQLFSERGYAATSTRMISKQAAVSEGLIFRHYQNKEGLLNAVYAEGKTKIKELYAPILRKRVAKRKKIDVDFKLRLTLSKRVLAAVKFAKTKKAFKTEKLIGCSIKTIRTNKFSLESLPDASGPTTIMFAI